MITQLSLGSATIRFATRRRNPLRPGMVGNRRATRLIIGMSIIGGDGNPPTEPTARHLPLPVL